MSWKRLASPNHWLNLALPPEDANLDSSTQAGPWRPFGQTWWSVSGDGSKFQLCWTLPVAWLGILCLSFPSQSQLAENASQSDFLREKILNLQVLLGFLENVVKFLREQW